MTKLTNNDVLRLPPLERAIAYVGTSTNLARQLGVVRSNVTRWRTTGHVPYKHRFSLERLTRGTPYAINLAEFERDD